MVFVTMTPVHSSHYNVRFFANMNTGQDLNQLKSMAIETCKFHKNV